MDANLTLRVRRLYDEAILPVYATDGSACFDLHAALGGPVTIPAHSAFTVGTGINVEVPAGYMMSVFSRSGHAFKNDVRLGNCVGVIDSDYRGEVCVRVRNDGNVPFTVHPGDRIAQATLVPVPRVSIEEVDMLSHTARGEGGFGSTGR